MRASRTFGKCCTALFATMLLFLAPRPAAAQTAGVDPHWGVLAEMAERDFHLDSWLGKRGLWAYRWEVPGQRMSLVSKFGFAEKHILVLDPATGRISEAQAGHEDRALTWIKADATGTLWYANSPADDKVYVERLGEGRYRFGGLILVETTADTPAGRSAAALIAQGELRAADPSMRTAAVATTSPIATGNAPSWAPSSSIAALTPIQREALDRWVGIGRISYVDPTTPGFEPDGWSIRTAQWVNPGQRYEERFLSDTTGPSTVTWDVGSGGSLVPRDSPPAMAGLAGWIDANGQIAFEWQAAGKRYRRVVTANPSAPTQVVIVDYDDPAGRRKAPQWREVYRGYGSPVAETWYDAMAPLIEKQSQLKASPWGALSALPGTLWYCLGHEPEQWLMRRRIPQGEVGLLDEAIPVMRLTVARWVDPERTLEVVTKLADGRGWTDTITLQPDGTFQMNTVGVKQFAVLTGHRDPSGAVVFPIANYPFYDDTISNEIIFSASYIYGTQVHMDLSRSFIDPARCDMQPFDEAKLPQWTKELADAQSSAMRKIQLYQRGRQDIAADRAAGQQMIAGMQADLFGAILGGGGSGAVAYSPQTPGPQGGTQASGFLQELQSMADIAHQEAQRSERRLARSIESAGRGESTREDARVADTDASASVDSTGGQAEGIAIPESGSTSPPRKLYSWCRAIAGPRVVYISPVGSRDVSVDEQQAWRASMEQEFSRQLPGAVDSVQCDIDDDGDFAYTRNSVASDNPVEVQWAPH